MALSTFSYIHRSNEHSYRTDHSQHRSRGEVCQPWSRIRGKIQNATQQLSKAERAPWSPLCCQARFFCYFGSDNCTSGSKDLSTEAALLSFHSCNCDWRMPELADQLGSSRFCQQDQKTNLSEHCDIITLDFQVWGAQDFPLSAAFLHLFSLPPTLFLRQQIKSPTMSQSGENKGLAAATQIPNFVITIVIGSNSIIKVTFI